MRFFREGASFLKVCDILRELSRPCFPVSRGTFCHRFHESSSLRKQRLRCSSVSDETHSEFFQWMESSASRSCRLKRQRCEDRRGGDQCLQELGTSFSWNLSFSPLRVSASLLICLCRQCEVWFFSAEQWHFFRFRCRLRAQVRACMLPQR